MNRLIDSVTARGTVVILSKLSKTISSLDKKVIKYTFDRFHLHGKIFITHKEPYLSTLGFPEAVFLVMCNLSMNEL